MAEQLATQLEQVLSHTHVLVEADEVARYTRDWTGRWTGDTTCVVRPGSTQQVADVLHVCRRAGVAVVPQGGNTGLVGGAVPTDGAVVLSTERFDHVGDVDASGRVTVGAGATLRAVADVATAAGWAVGVDLASRDSATIGGMVATDAGGRRVVAHGSMRDQVLGLEVVLPDGTVARPWMEGLRKDTAGLDVLQLLIGSEGTLGVITEVMLQLVRPMPTVATVALGTTGHELARVVDAVRDRVTDSAATLTACEFMTATSSRLVADAMDLRVPLPDEVVLLVDLAGDVDDDLLGDLDGLVTGDAVVGLDAATREDLWQLREAHTEAVSTHGVPVKLDVGIPLDRLAWFLEAAAATVATVVPGATCVLFGHAAEGNVHVNVPDAQQHAEVIEEAVYGLVADAGGTVSAEHGVGRAKVAHLARTRDEGSLAAMRQLKLALDPDGLCNPDVVLPRAVRW